MYDRNRKSKRILTKLRVLDYEYICDRIAKFHKKIFITRVINIQILTTKYFSFQYSVTYRHSGRTMLLPQSTRDSASVNWRNTGLHHSTALTLTQSTTSFKGCCRMYTTARFVTSTSWSHAWSRVGTFPPQVVIDEAVRQWRPHLWACVRAHGGHFEHRL